MTGFAMARGVSLAALKKGRAGRVLAVQGGRSMARRLESMGIRPGVLVVKESNSFLKGPVTIRVGNAQVALGYGMASRILVEPTEADSR